jgi:hypothetical protein
MRAEAELRLKDLGRRNCASFSVVARREPHAWAVGSAGEKVYQPERFVHVGPIEVVATADDLAFLDLCNGVTAPALAARQAGRSHDVAAAEKPSREQ